MLQAMQQQFERVNVVFNEIRDQINRQDTIIATLREEHPQRIPNARRQERRAHVDILMMTARMSSKMKRIKLH